MIIKDIQHIDSGQTRTDGLYPQRIGCTGKFYWPPLVGLCALFFYQKDNEGNEKGGALQTSTVQRVKRSGDALIVETMNSRYIFLNTNNL